MLQWFISFYEFAEFSESSAPFKENPNETSKTAQEKKSWEFSKC